jgi:MFS transporter, OFA family, oxalate/formate antiporter
MKKHLTVLASFIIMLCTGSVYAWSIIASELIEVFDFSASQSQIIFGMIIAVFPVTMIFVGQLGIKVKHRYFGYISGLLFFSGYTLASFSQGNFMMIFLGIGVLSGVATGFGYWVALTSPVQWFPEKKGLITGIAAAGFGLGAVFMSEAADIILTKGFNILELLRIVGISYGIIIIVSSNLISQVPINTNLLVKPAKASQFLNSKTFRKLCLGIFLGTFAGLLIIGSLGIIGGQKDISIHILVHGVALFAIANFLGRLTWGYFSDYLGASFSIFLALLVQSLAIISLNIFTLTDVSYLVIAFFIGFGFGGNFVLFAKETAQVFGMKNLGIIYPYVFLGYAVAGIAGPMSGGVLFDVSGSYFYAILLASSMSLIGSAKFLLQFISHQKRISKITDYKINQKPRLANGMKVKKAQLAGS